ncbi:MAG: serine/threonine protein kinase, partial [Clostridia bacterium]|nr:serine/threonine protein kinase [Clostridia bacterium]
MDKYIGKRLDGRYEIKEIIGVGGMAYVYKAYDNIDDRVVAVKILKEEFLTNEEFTRRFKNESKAIAILSHPNIVRVYDVSFGERLQYIVMEYVDGITLKEYIDQKKDIPWKEAVHFTVQVLRALQHAHDKGIVHRDIKPQNIMLLADGTIKVTDFGIAQFSRNDIRPDGGQAIGSVHYISPEQASGNITDEKADIYSLGVMLYEMLTGKLPFDADNAVSVAIMQLQSQPDKPRDINPGIPEGLEEITIKAMQKDPSKRYQSAAEMLYDI